ETADHRGVLRSVLFEDQIDDVIFAVVRKIDVDVRELVECHALLVEEAAEVEIEADGADAADFQAIAGERVGRAAARDPFDAAPAALLENVPHDQKIFFVADFGNDGQLLLELW